MIKAIVVDMDGTFLDDNKEYDTDRFLAQYQQLKHLGIKFVVASGNQLQRLIAYFPDIHSELTFIAENGAKISSQNKIIYENPIPSNLIQPIFDLLKTNSSFKDFRLVLSGKQAAYIKKNAPTNYRKKAAYFYRNLQEINDYDQLDDTIYKFAFNFPTDQVANCEKLLNSVFKGKLKAITSGHEAIDLVADNTGKEFGLEILEKEWHLSTENFAAFGDNLNDLGMITRVGYGCVVSNGQDSLKLVANKVIGTNNHHAVLDELDQIILKEKINHYQSVNRE
ncbi:Cof-type HAD-IIB family hydrolase [Enterococcus sp. LJL99]